MKTTTREQYLQPLTTTRVRRLVGTFSAALMLTGCAQGQPTMEQAAGPSASHTRTVEAPAPEPNQVAEALQRGDGLWIVPGALENQDGEIAVRPLAVVDNDPFCSDVLFGSSRTEQPENVQLYTYRNGQFSEFEGFATSEYATRVAALGELGTLQCVNFGPEDSYDEAGVPIAGKLADGKTHPFLYDGTGSSLDRSLDMTLEPRADS